MFFQFLPLYTRPVFMDAVKKVLEGEDQGMVKVVSRVNVGTEEDRVIGRTM